MSLNRGDFTDEVSFNEFVSPWNNIIPEGHLAIYNIPYFSTLSKHSNKEGQHFIFFFFGGGLVPVLGLPANHRLFFSFHLVLNCLKACGILLPGAGIKPESPALEGGFVTAGSPGKSQERQPLFLGNANARSLALYRRAPTVRNPGGDYHPPPTISLGTAILEVATLSRFQWPKCPQRGRVHTRACKRGDVCD